MKKIRILTYWGVANYGAWAQAYAFNKILTSLYPLCDVKHINYLEQSHWACYYKNDKKGLNNFNYNWDEIPHTTKMGIQELEQQEIDVLITGADSIWEEIFTGVIEHDWHLIGNNMSGCKRIISYAPSSGILNFKNDIPQYAIKGLRNYDAISVRDVVTKNFVKKAIGIDVPIVLDPALLWDFSNDPAIKKTTYKRYIAVYGNTWNIEFINNVKKYADRNGFILISIGFVNEWCDINFKRNELRALEWIGMIASSECVVTSTFHGLMIALSYRKQIKFCQVDYVKNRSQTLIDLCGIPNHVEEFDKEIDYSFVNKQLKQAKECSISWLQNAINL